MELEIMHVIWDLQEVTINQVLDRINSDRSAPLRRTTIQVQMNRLENKGWLQHREDGRTYYYSTNHDREATLADLAGDIQDRAFGGSCTDLVKCLLDHRKITPEELTRLRRLIDEIE